MKQTLCSLAMLLTVGAALAYDHASYNQTGLVIQYDGPDNGANASTLVNLGSAGSAFNLAAQTTDDKVEDGVIKVGHLAAGNYKNHGWAYSSAASTAAGDGAGWTIEYVGAMSGGESKNGYSYVIGIDNGTDSGRLLYLASGQPADTSIGAEAMAGSYNYETSSFVKGANLQANNNSVFATRTVTLDTSTKTVTFYENGVAIGSGTTKGTTSGGVKRINIGDMRKGRAYGWWEGEIKSVRIYSRVLSAAEIASNYTVDGYRFYGQAVEAGQLVIANNPGNIGMPTPPVGVQSPASGASVVCSAADPFYKDGVRYAATGYTLETSTDGGSTWGTPVSYTGTSYTYVNEGVTTRLTWQWEPTHYRLYVTRNGGTETFAFSPAVAIADDVDTTTPGGYFPVGTQVSVTAQTMSTPVVSTFTKWTGDAGETTANPVTVTMGGVRSIKAWFSRPWALDVSANQVFKDEWTLQCGWYGGNAGDANGSRTIASVVSGSGVLDMSELNRDLAAQNVTRLVRVIGDGAFYGNNSVTGLVLPAQEYGNGIVSIGGSAFQNCSNLAGEIDFWSVVEIGNNAFNCCEKLSGDLVLPVCTSVGNRSFRMANPDKAFRNGRLYAPELLTMEEGAFAACAFTSAYLPKFAPATVSGNYPFYNAKHFTNIVFSADVTVLHPRFVYVGTPASGVLVLDFPKNRPTTAFATWMESTKTSQIVIQTPAKYSSNWTSDTANYVPLADVTDTPSAAVRAAAKHIIGQYGGCWLAEIPEPGVVILFR